MKKGQFKSSASKRSKAQRAYNSKPAQKKNRAARNRARRKAQRSGRVSKGDGLVVDHVKPLSRGGSRSGSTRVTSAKVSQKQGGRLKRRRSKR